MSDETFFLVDLAAYISSIVILAFGAYRALTFSRVFLGNVFRSRALWTAALLILWIVPNDTEFFAYQYSASLNSLIGISAGVTIIIAWVLVVGTVVFIDRNILVARELDFFHRNSLRWGDLRLISYVGAPVSFAVSLVGGATGNGIVQLAGNLGLSGVLGYASASLLVSGLRLSDLVMRRFLKYAGGGLVLLVATIAFPSPGPPLGIVYDAFLVLGCLLLYLSARSLASLNRIGEDVAVHNPSTKFGTVIVQPARLSPPTKPRG
jgi:hypothetical protein